jgi:hypothetical protein
MREAQEDDPTKAEIARVGASIGPYHPRGVERGTEEYTAIQREYGEATKEAVERAIGRSGYERLRQQAEQLVARNPDYAGRTVDEVTKELMAEALEGASTDARQTLTRARTRR